MANIGNITIKKADGTTDIVYDGIVGASGGDPALFRQDTGANSALPVGMRATVRWLSKWNGNKSARQQELTFQLPYALQDSTTTRFSASDVATVRLFVSQPQNIPQSVLSEAVHQALNFFAHATNKSQAATGHAPT